MSQRELYAKGGITRWYWDYRDRAVLRHTARETSILDIGCGEGVTLEKVRQQEEGRMLCGVDRDPMNVLACRKHDLAATVSNIYKLNNVTAGWNCVLLLDVIEHLEYPDYALEQIHHKLGRDGKLILMFPNDRLFFWARMAFLKFRAAFARSGHVKKWNLSGMIRTLRGAGFSILITERLPSFSPWPLHHLIVARKI